MRSLTRNFHKTFSCFWGQITHSRQKPIFRVCTPFPTEVRAVLFELDPTGSQAKKLTSGAFWNGVGGLFLIHHHHVGTRRGTLGALGHQEQELVQEEGPSWHAGMPPIPLSARLPLSLTRFPLV